MANITLDDLPVLSLSLQLPLNGAWSAELQVGADSELAAGDFSVLKLPGLELNGRIVRAGTFAERLRVRMTGGFVDWNEAQAVRHYKNTTADAVLSDLGLEPDQPIGTALPFWTLNPGTTGSAVQELATYLGVSWRVMPDGAVRLRAEAPETVTDPEATEIGRDAARGLIEIAPDLGGIVPGCAFGDDQVGDVLYDQTESLPLRCRYYTEARGRIRDALTRLIRWVTRDALFLGQFTCRVVRQAADGTLDLLPDDDRIRAQGLQSVPIRHGLPGCTVEVDPGERVLLAFDGGDPTKPYAALWHEGSVKAVHIGGSSAVALAELVDARLASIRSFINSHSHLDPVSGALPAPTPPLGPLAATAAQKLTTS